MTCLGHRSLLCFASHRHDTTEHEIVLNEKGCYANAYSRRFHETRRWTRRSVNLEDRVSGILLCVSPCELVFWSGETGCPVIWPDGIVGVLG